MLHAKKNHIEHEKIVNFGYFQAIGSRSASIYVEVNIAFRALIGYVNSEEH